MKIVKWLNVHVIFQNMPSISFCNKNTGSISSIISFHHSIDKSTEQQKKTIFTPMLTHTYYTIHLYKRSPNSFTLKAFENFFNYKIFRFYFHSPQQ